MSLPTTPSKSPIQKKQHLEALLFPVLVVLVILAIFLVGVFVPKLTEKTKKETKKELSVTKSIKVISASGETIEVPPEVTQMTPEQLKVQIDSKEKVLIVQIVEEGKAFDQPHIAGSIFLTKKSFETSVNSLSSSNTHIFVSKDGYDSALVVSKVLKFGLPREKNFNLEGGIDAWKEKGYALEN